MSSFFLAVPAHCSFQILFQGGMIFYIVPMIVITINDITAYYVGFLIGKTPLIKVNKFRTYFKVLLCFSFTPDCYLIIQTLYLVKSKKDNGRLHWWRNIDCYPRHFVYSTLCNVRIPITAMSGRSKSRILAILFFNGYSKQLWYSNQITLVSVRLCIARCLFATIISGKFT